MTRTKIIYNKPRDRYNQHKYNATKSGREFRLTFDEWWDIWEKSGHYEDRGRSVGCYCMSRVGDLGAYEVGNVFIQLWTSNSSDGWKNGKHNNRKLPCIVYGVEYESCAKAAQTLNINESTMLCRLNRPMAGHSWK